MRRSTRKLIGTAAMLVFVSAYALLAMALVQGRIQDAPQWIQVLVYVVIGLIWVVPLMPLIRWMERADV